MEPDLREAKPTEQFNFVGIGIAILALVAIAFFVDINSIKIWIEKAGVWGPLVFILLKISTLVIAPLSGGPLYPIVGLLFGFWPGIIYIIIGDFLGYTICFFISRFFGRKIVNKLLSGKESSMITRIVDHVSNAKGFFHACLTLFALPEVLAYGAGLSRLPYLKFIFILSPMAAIAASVLVFFGSILNPSGSSLLISLGVPALGAVAILIGGFFFTRGIMKVK